MASPSAETRQLTRQDARTLFLASLGGALEFYDFIIFVFFAAAIGQLFFPADMPDWLRQLQTFALFAAGYLARPLGGIVMAHFGDLFGRKRVFTFSVFLMAVPTLIMGLLPTYASIGVAAPILLLVMRMLQGAAIGGEAPGAWVFVAEHVPARRVGIACGMLTGGLTGGILLGSLMATGINMAYSPAEVTAFAWRIPFITGGIFGLLAMYLRRWLHETPVFEQMRERAGTAREMPIKTVLRGQGVSVAISMLLTWMLTAAIVVVILMTPALFQKMHGLAPAVTLQANVAATFTLTVMAVVFGALLDRFGTLRVGLAGGVLLIAATYGLYYGTEAKPENLLALYALAGAAVGMITVVPYVMVHAFPVATRFTGVSFSYNLAYAIFGGITPLAVSLLMAANRHAAAHYVGAVVLVGMAALGWNAARNVRTAADLLPAEAQPAAR
ncbi:Nitrate/nitrite transporter NarK [Roseomonas rosea]|uniref:Nitrate/nitrite transporter NarK n=1 Tax=Muricoccus roseus TaxID=198092 RepID=A0A1M6S9G1_9PROT|nr:MFS transporter [Roseomonas rosea]SHK41197.1 Nitrate/nitrite transporter NarK [Roseomonas rosea]